MVKPPNHSNTMGPWCPRCFPHVPMVLSCHDPQETASSDLWEWHCMHCTHKGMTAGRGMQLVFRSGTQYIFAYSSSADTLTVTLSSEAIALFQSHHVAADELARKAAEWALLQGHTNGRVDLTLKNDELADFYWHFYYCQASGHQSI